MRWLWYRVLCWWGWHDARVTYDDGEFLHGYCTHCGFEGIFDSEGALY